jgi:hypothetical protein
MHALQANHPRRESLAALLRALRYIDLLPCLIDMV